LNQLNRVTQVSVIWTLGCVLAACGGGTDDGASAGPPVGATTYSQVTPVAGASDVYGTVAVDDSNNTIAGTYTQRVASVNADGSYVLTQVDPTNTSVVVNGIDYHFDAAVLDFDGKGHETGASFTAADGAVQTCTFTTESGGHALPWWVGQTFALALQESCNPGSTQLFQEAGSVASLESVTVPAGTFMALKLTITQQWTDASGQNVTEQITEWSDPAHWLFTIKRTIAYTRSGNVPAHYVNSQTVELQSRSSS
jgi:hypothetical protein